jgi:hypothetical protein
MREFTKIINLRLSSERIDLRFAQAISFAAGPAILVVAISGLSRMSRTPAEVLIGVLAAVGTAMSFIIMGLVLGLMGELRSR